MTEVWEQGSAATIAVKVNGETVGNEPGTLTLKQVAAKYAASHGLKTFSVYVGNRKADTTEGDRTLGQLEAASVELVAKEARG